MTGPPDIGDSESSREAEQYTHQIEVARMWVAMGFKVEGTCLNWKTKDREWVPFNKNRLLYSTWAPFIWMFRIKSIHP